MIHFKSYSLLLFIFVFLIETDMILGQADSSFKIGIEDYKVTTSEYQNFTKETDLESRYSKEVTDQMFLSYHLKLYDARKRGFDTLNNYLNSLEDFRQMLAVKKTEYDYLSDSMLMSYYKRTQWEIELSHIRIDIKGNIQTDTLDEYNFIDSIRHRGTSEEEFKALAYNYSDSRTATDSGYIGTLSGMQAPFPLEEMVFNTDVGSVSRIYRTSGSYHLVFVHSKTKIQNPMGTFQDVKKEVRNYYQNDETRRNYLRDKYLREVLSHYGFQFFVNAYEEFVKYGATSFKEGNWVEPESMDVDRALFQLGNRTATYTDFSDYLSKQQYAYRIVNYRPVINSHFQEYMFQFTRKYDQANIEQRNADVNRMLKEFSNGLLVQMIDSELSGNAVQDVKGLKKQFRINKDNYKVQGYSGLVIWFKDMQSRRRLEFEIKNMDVDTDSLYQLLEGYDGIEKIRRVTVKQGVDPVIDHFIWKRSPYLPEYSLVITVGELTELPASNYQEALSQVVYDLSQRREETYLKQLRKKYKTEMY